MHSYSPAALMRTRRAAGYSRVDVAQRLGLCRGSVAAYEQGVRHPRVDTLGELAELYGCGVDEFYEGRSACLAR